ncbi:hypothetical protein E2562_006639 [Oryza meyeriana var. granulata]|uniref:Uncharacterized protein n=1 Tax=Oryza meyeriana var. granulata TaxID=110450 RepID=A0A6G1EFX5_9ORYZ|nr:hypothetical protein E2562_006639 [Oryza meyeriana var. granulata]
MASGSSRRGSRQSVASELAAARISKLEAAAQIDELRGSCGLAQIVTAPLPPSQQRPLGERQWWHPHGCVTSDYRIQDLVAKWEEGGARRVSSSCACAPRPCGASVAQCRTAYHLG